MKIFRFGILSGAIFYAGGNRGWPCAVWGQSVRRDLLEFHRQQRPADSRSKRPGPRGIFGSLENLAAENGPRPRRRFPRAQQAAPRDLRFILAHAVALGLSEHYQEAITELSRFSARLWRGTQPRAGAVDLHLRDDGQFLPRPTMPSAARIVFRGQEQTIIPNEAVSMPATWCKEARITRPISRPLRIMRWQ